MLAMSLLFFFFLLFSNSPRYQTRISTSIQPVEKKYLLFRVCRAGGALASQSG